MSSFYILKCMAAGGPLHFTLESDWPNQGSGKWVACFLATIGIPVFIHLADAIELETKIDSKARERIYPELTWNPLAADEPTLAAALQAAESTTFRPMRPSSPTRKETPRPIITWP